MKVLLDESMPQKLRLELPDHDVWTVGFLGWSGIKNGELLGKAEQLGMDVLVTGDQSLTYQQNMASRTIAIVTLNSNHWPIIKYKLAEVVAAVDAAVPGSFREVRCDVQDEQA